MASIDLLVACAIDHDLERQIRSGRPTSSRGRFDLSVIESLRRVCREVVIISVREGSAASIDELVRIKPEVVFNLALSAHPCEAGFVGCLELLEIPYTGSGPLGISLTADKIRSRLLLRAAGLNVPEFVEITNGHLPEIGFPPPYIVKPRSNANSEGIYSNSVVATRKGIASCASRIRRQLGGSVVCEEFIVGREFRVGLVELPSGFKIVGVSEWHFGNARPGWGFRFGAIKNNRRVRQSHEVTKTSPEITRALNRQLLDIARVAATALDVEGYAALDVRLDEAGRITVLELNSNPGLSAANDTWSQPSFDANIKHIIDCALRKHRDG